MKETITVEVAANEWPDYSGLKSALEAAMETMKDGPKIRRVAKLVNDIEDAYAEYSEERERAQELKELKSDVQRLQAKLAQL